LFVGLSRFCFQKGGCKTLVDSFHPLMFYSSIKWALPVFMTCSVLCIISHLTCNIVGCFYIYYYCRRLVGQVAIGIGVWLEWKGWGENVPCYRNVQMLRSCEMRPGNLVYIYDPTV